MGHVAEQKTRIITHQEERPFMFAKTRETLPDTPQLLFQIIFRRIRYIAVRRRGDGLLPFLFQAAPAAAVPQGLETLAAGDGN